MERIDCDCGQEHITCPDGIWYDVWAGSEAINSDLVRGTDKRAYGVVPSLIKREHLICSRLKR
jgi:hypothetical protein